MSSNALGGETGQRTARRDSESKEKVHGGESAWHPRPRVSQRRRRPDVDYCTVMDPFMPSARWGTQWTGYVPFGTFANEIVTLSPGFIRKLLVKGDI